MRRFSAKIYLFLIISLMPLLGQAAQISAQQIAQFKALPLSQQKALAKSMGIDLNSILPQLSSSTDTEQKPEINAKGMGVEAKPRPVEKAKPVAKNNPQPFGYNVFANAPETFAPLTDVAIPNDYVIGSGDEILIQLFGKDSSEYQLTVNREGNIVIPELGPFKVTGLTFEKLKAFLSSRIKERIIGVDTVITLSSLRSLRVFVLGEAYKPGPYTLSALSSITRAIFAAGGVTNIGTLRNIQLKRAGKLVQTLDLYNLLINGDSTGDKILKNGDVIFIPTVGQQVTLQGEVTRPAIYEISANETLADAVKLAGGFTPKAFEKAIKIERYSQSNKNVVTLNYFNNAAKTFNLMNGDVIKVEQSSSQFEGAVKVSGAVVRPGNFQWHKGMKLSELFPSASSHLLNTTDLHYSLIIREKDIAKNIEVLQFSLADILLNNNSNQNIELQPNDEVLVFSKNSEKNSQREAEKNLDKSIVDLAKEDKNKVAKTELSDFSRQKLLLPVIEKLKNQANSGQPVQLVEIDGQVKVPGVYPLAQNGTVKDLLNAAGGVTESAYLVKADLTRTLVNSELASVENSSVNLAKALSGDSNQNIALQSKDRLNVLQIPSWSENLVVELRGEFKFPGKYTIKRGETLSSLIEKAGGLTDYAFPDGAVFAREKLKALERENIKKITDDLRIEIASKSMSDSSAVSSFAGTEKLLNSVVKTDPIGRLVLNLPRVMEHNNYDIMLENGDVLTVPTFKNSVNVIGQVQVTSSHIYQPELTVDDYLEKSGGIKKRADDERIYIISANGSIKHATANQWFSSDDATLKPGDTIVVPLDSEYKDGIALWSAATGIMYNTAVALLAVKGL